MEVDLNRPHAIRFYKKGNQPENAFGQDEFLDFKYDEKNPKFEVDLSFMQKTGSTLCPLLPRPLFLGSDSSFFACHRAGKYQRKYQFASLASRTRFIELLLLFQKPETRTHYIHPDVLNVIKYLVPSTNKGLQPTAPGTAAAGAHGSASAGSAVDSKAAPSGGGSLDLVWENAGMYNIRQLIDRMLERAPFNIFVKELAEESDALPKDEKGYASFSLLPAPAFPRTQTCALLCVQ